MNFIPDIRNIGGRKAIKDIMTNHYQKIDGARPVLNTRESPQQNQSGLKLPNFNGKLKTSIYLQNSHISPKKKLYRNRLNKTEMFEHYNNIKHMQRRINDIGSVMFYLAY